MMCSAARVIGRSAIVIIRNDSKGFSDARDLLIQLTNSLSLDYESLGDSLSLSIVDNIAIAINT